MKQLVFFMYGATGKDRTSGKYFSKLAASDPQLSELFETISYPCSIGMCRYILSNNTSAFESVTQKLRKTVAHAHRKYSNIVFVCHGITGLVARQFIVEEAEKKRPINIDRILLFATPNSTSDLSRMADSISWNDFLEKNICANPEILAAINTEWAANELGNKVAVKYALGDQDHIIDASRAADQWGSGYFARVSKRDHWNVFTPKAHDDEAFLLAKQFLLAETPAQITYPENLRAISDVLNWELDARGLESAKKDMIYLVNLLNPLAWRSRQLLCALIQKSNQISYNEMFVQSAEIVKTMNLTAYELEVELSELKECGFIDTVDGEPSEIIRLRCVDDKWLIWDQLKAYCQKTGISLRRLIVDLQFDLLDSKTQ